MPDMVNHPPHYTAGEIECIDAIRAVLGPDGFLAFCQGNAIKYLWRAGKKGGAVEDFQKAAWYATKAAEQEVDEFDLAGCGCATEYDTSPTTPTRGRDE